MRRFVVALRRKPRSTSGRAAIQEGYRVMYREAHTLLEELADATLAGTRRDYLTEVAALRTHVDASDVKSTGR